MRHCLFWLPVGAVSHSWHMQRYLWTAYDTCLQLSVRSILMTTVFLQFVPPVAAIGECGAYHIKFFLFYLIWRCSLQSSLIQSTSCFKTYIRYLTACCIERILCPHVHTHVCSHLCHASCQHCVCVVCYSIVNEQVLYLAPRSFLVRTRWSSQVITNVRDTRGISCMLFIFTVATVQHCTILRDIKLIKLTPGVYVL